MGVLDNIRVRDQNARVSRSFVEDDAQRDAAVSAEAYTGSLEWRDEKELNEHPDSVNEKAEDGLKKAEASALVWSKKVVYSIYAWIWVCFFALAFHQSMIPTFGLFAYADFQNAPQITTANIAGILIGGILKLPLAKILNLFGRAEGLFMALVAYVMGIIILAACTGPASYATGYVFYWIGYDLIYLILQIFIADTTGLRNRAWAIAFASTPFILTAFTAPLAANSFLATSGWRWGYGSFAIIQPFVFGPLIFVFKFYERKAVKLGLYKKSSSGRTTMQSIAHYIHEFDVIGAFLLMAAFVLFLLPFSLTSYNLTGYGSATFIAMVVVGLCLFPVFVIWERFFARAHFVRWEVFKNRSVAGACLLSALMNFSFDLWDTYLTNFLYIVYDLNVTDAGYMAQIYNVGSCFWSVLVGIYIYKTKHFKYLCLFFGQPLMILGSGLMIYFRGNDHGIGFIIMCQIFIAFAGGTNVIGNDMAVMAGADREGIPMALCLVGLFQSVGGAIGYAVCAAIFNSTFESTLRAHLPDNLKSQASYLTLHGVKAQIPLPEGPEREAVAYAWGWTQRQNCIASTAILALGLPAILMWRNVNVDKKQVKGTVI
ncbi:hypothetical protein N7468_002655 [Penicillium chermesinum]|uniref:Siderochrome-iron transporter n=1 Tax=Penicillium chermesinum TaxID=63820 RepID=A0A9W9TY62_9EURO|nr:uncharacterized protein N7468_002655 [Penicillium chermesinum]KAJ5247672.1 hypothetical protein N7468_002655 [Penicillium chermesinum]KAJ6151437.1 hypothetical protein N7470_007034 [Penicillium chermesinum]